MTWSLLVLEYVSTLLTDAVISCPLALSCSFWWEANRSSKSFSPSPLRAFKFKIRIRQKNSTGWDISINCTALPLMKRTPVQWGNCNLKVTVAVNFIYTYFGLADPWKPHIHAQLWMEALRHTSQKKKKKKRWSESTSYWWEKPILQHRGKEQKFNRAGRLLASVHLVLGYQEMILLKGVTQQI